MTYDPESAAMAQEARCHELEMPRFAPNDGRCPNCRRNIYEEGGYSLEYAAEHAITGCPFCHHSFVE